MTVKNRKSYFRILLFAGMIALSLETQSYPGIVIEFPSGKVLQHEDASQSWHPASLTKLMTLYLTFEALRSGTLSLDEKISVSVYAASQPRTHLGLRKGETLTVGDAVKAVATISANDAAVVLAERLKGSEALFAEEMTRRAKQLGMNATVFYNASGLPDPGQKTTARDMGLLAMALIRSYPEFFHYFSNRSIQFKGKHRWSTNGFVASYKGADGLKTGFTCGSGYNLIATAVRDQIRLIGVVLGAGSKSKRSVRMRTLLDSGFLEARLKKDRITIWDIDTQQTVELSTPPFRLKGNRCASSATQAALNATALPFHALTQEGSLPGWGVLLGIKSAKNDAVSILQKARSMLQHIKISTTPALLKRNFRKGSSWKVLLVGLKKAQAGRACNHLLSNAVTCVIQSPKRMNSPGYAMR